MIGQRSSDYVRSLWYFKLNLSSVDHVLNLVLERPTVVRSMPRAIRVVCTPLIRMVVRGGSVWILKRIP